MATGRPGTSNVSAMNDLAQGGWRGWQKYPITFSEGATAGARERAVAMSGIFPDPPPKAGKLHLAFLASFLRFYANPDFDGMMVGETGFQVS